MFKDIILQEIEEFKKFCVMENADEGLFMVLGVIRLFIRLELISVEFMEYAIDLIFKEHHFKINYQKNKNLDN